MSKLRVAKCLWSIFKGAKGDLKQTLRKYELHKFKEVGDIAVQYDPVHAALPWAGVRFLRQIAVTSKEQMAATLTGVEAASSAISQCSVYEILYIDSNEDGSTKDVDGAQDGARKSLCLTLEKTYRATLYFLARAHRLYNSNSVCSALKGIMEPGFLENLVNELQSLSLEASKAADACTAVCARLAHDDIKRLRAMLNEIQSSIIPIGSNVANLCQVVEEERRKEILQWIFPIPYEENYMTARKGYTKKYRTG